MNFYDLVLSTKRHLVVVGATRSGKSTTVLNTAYEAYKRGYDVYVLDFYGEYSLPFQRYKPILPFNKRILGFIISSALRPLSGGLEIASAVEVALSMSSSWSAFLKTLLSFAASPVFRHGAQAAYSRLLYLEKCGVLVDEELPFYPAPTIIDLSCIDRLDARIVLSLCTVAWFLAEAQVRDFSRPVLFVVEEAKFQDIPGLLPVLYDALDQLAKKNVKLCIVMQCLPENRDRNNTLRQQCLIIHNLGQIAEDYILRHNFSEDIRGLELGEVVVYHPESRSWIKCKVKPHLFPTNPRVPELVPVENHRFSIGLVEGKSQSSREVTKEESREELEEKVEKQEVVGKWSLREVEEIFIKAVSRGLEKKLKSIEERINRLERSLPARDVVDRDVVNKKIMVLAEKIERLERRIAADSASVERLFDFIESYEARFRELDSRLSRLERAVRKMAEFLEYREQLRSIRGEEV